MSFAEVKFNILLTKCLFKIPVESWDYAIEILCGFP